MFESDLYGADGEPVDLYVEDPRLGRRVRVRLCARGPEIRYRVLDVEDYSEPPLPEQPRTSSPDPRQSPIDGDDFVTYAGDPAGARRRS